jgi:hypothetical protein
VVEVLLDLRQEQAEAQVEVLLVVPQLWEALLVYQQQDGLAAEEVQPIQLQLERLAELLPHVKTLLCPVVL